MYYLLSLRELQLLKHLLTILCRLNGRYELPLLKVRKNRKADWRAVNSSKKQKDEFDLFAVKSKKANKTNSVVRFFGRS